MTQDISRDKRRIVDFRNQIAHGYFGIDENIVWDVINNKLSSLYHDLLEMIEKNDINITDAIESAKEENTHNKAVLASLKELAEKLQR